MIKEDIEKAANEFADREYEYNDIDRNALYKGFYWGAQWRINSVWHDVSEPPKPDKLIYILRKDGIIKQIYTYDGVDKLFNTLMVYKWAYIEDIIPNMEE
jgi:hypothetical protein